MCFLEVFILLTSLSMYDPLSKWHKEQGEASAHHVLWGHLPSSDFIEDLVSDKLTGLGWSGSWGWETSWFSAESSWLELGRDSTEVLWDGALEQGCSLTCTSSKWQKKGQENQDCCHLPRKALGLEEGRVDTALEGWRRWALSDLTGLLNLCTSALIGFSS